MNVLVLFLNRGHEAEAVQAMDELAAHVPAQGRKRSASERRTGTVVVGVGVEGSQFKVRTDRWRFQFGQRLAQSFNKRTAIIAEQRATAYSCQVSNSYDITLVTNNIP